MKKIALSISTLLLCAGAIAKEYHVSKNGKDTNPGTPNAPLLTIQAAANSATPGDVITVHEGIYRERVNPPRGGTSEDKCIVYQAAPGEKVEIKGSEVIKRWTEESSNVWKTEIPNTLFGDFNPYSDLIHGDWFKDKGREHHTGAVYLNGEWLVEAAKLGDLLQPGGSARPATKSVVLLNIAWLQPGKSDRIPAVRYAEQSGVKNAPCEEGGECVGWIEEGDWIRYEGVDFGSGTDLIEIRAASVTTGGLIELRLGGPNGVLLGTCLVPNTGGWQAWASFTARIKPVKGIRTLCLTFRGPPPPETNDQFWFAKVDSEHTTIWAQFKGVNPNEELVEINVRRTVFYPDKPGRNFITVRGFTMRHAATPWAPPTAEQIGLIGTHWSKGWIIENNMISHSICSGIALGKHGDEFDNTSANSAEGYVETIKRAQAYTIPWTKENIGHHIVRDNTISHCEQAGIVGSLGCAFSTVADNTIHDIHVRQLFAGAEMAGIKFHGAIDTEISRNHIYRTCRGLWLDWMAQGTRVSQNLFHDNTTSEDLFVEVNHGPYVVDNNIFLSKISLRDNSQGGAFLHNLFGGSFSCRPQSRITPYHQAHSTEIAGMETTRCGDNRFLNNIFVHDTLGIYEDKLPIQQSGNIYAEEGISFDAENGSVGLSTAVSEALANQTCKIVTTEMLGRAKFPDLPYEGADGKPLRIDTDYFGKKRNEANPTPGPFALPKVGKQTFKVWNKEQPVRETKKQDKPNIVLFISDDHGWADSGVYGDNYIRTPNIDKLAAESMRFTHAFAASPLCSPSRSVIQTGLMPHRNGAHKFATPINAGIKTMAAYFNEMGYETAHFGKFHTSPKKQFPYNYINPNEEEAASFLATYDRNAPLLLVVCTHPPHTPWIKNTTYDPSKITLPPNFVDTPETREDRANYYSDVTLMDSILGDVLDAVESKGIKENTLFIYTADQGANWAFAKWCVYDQGLRVPFIARWPGKIAPGSTTNAMINLADLLPTCMEAAGGSAPEDLDGRSIVPVLFGRKDEHRKHVFGTHTGNENGGPGTANHCPARTVRNRRFRYIFNLDPETTFTTHITGQKTGPHYLPHWDSWVEQAKSDEKARQLVHAYQHRPEEELYDLEKDPYEMNNLAGNPEYDKTLEELRAVLSEWRSSQNDFETDFK